MALNWIFSLLFLVLSLGTADFCSTPDAHVESILGRNADRFDGQIFSFLLFYISGYSAAVPGMDQIMNLAVTSKLMVYNAHSLVELVGDMDVMQLGRTCGITTDMATALGVFVALAHDTTHAVNRGIVGLREVLDCGTFNPIYTTLVHDAFCL